MKNKITSAIALIIFSVALVITSLIPALLAPKNQEGNNVSDVKMGIAISTKLNESKDAGAENGANVTAITIAAVTIDEQGKVVSCKIDAVDATINFDAKGAITTDLTTEIRTKKEQGTDYGMSADWNKDNTIGKEWDEQVAAFENYCIGKTAEEITGIAVNPDTGYVDGLATSCTMHPGNFQYVVAEAIKNATVTGAKSTDKLGLGVATKLNDSKDATAEKNGVAEVAVTVSATTVDATGKVTSILIDAVQASVEFDQKGAITNDISADVLTKKEKGDAYGMAADWNTANKIGKEWDEQVVAFENYCLGKNAEQITGISVNPETGYVDELATSCTMHPGNFQYVVAEAVNNAK